MRLHDEAGNMCQALPVRPPNVSTLYRFCNRSAAGGNATLHPPRRVIEQKHPNRYRRCQYD